MRRGALSIALTQELAVFLVHADASLVSLDHQPQSMPRSRHQIRPDLSWIGA